MARYKLTNEADRDLERLIDYGIQHFGFKKTLLDIGGMKSRFIEISETPCLWQAVTHIHPEYRRSIYGKHSIYYKINGDEVIIIRILGREYPKEWMN